MRKRILLSSIVGNLLICSFAFAYEAEAYNYEASFAEAVPVDSKLLKGEPPRELSFRMLVEKYANKCRHIRNLYNNICAINETDIDPNGRPNRILLFRGEPERFEQPATSSFFRWARSPQGPCANGCTNSQLTERVLSDIGLIVSEFDNPGGTDRYFIYNPDLRNWKRRFRPRGDIQASRGYSVMKILAISHLSGTKYLTFDQDAKNHYDPLISFSPSPYSAYSFQGRRAGGSVYIASVPTEQAHILSETECLNARPKPGNFYVVYNCWMENTFRGEDEIDAFIFFSADHYYGKVRIP